MYRLKMGKLQLLMASVMTSTPMMLSRNPVRAWCEESQSERPVAEPGQYPALGVHGCSRALLPQHSPRKSACGSDPQHQAAPPPSCFNPGAKKGKGSPS